MSHKIRCLTLGLTSTIAVLSCVHAGAAATVQVQAVPGVPFGVGQITVVLPEKLSDEAIDTAFLSITERDGRVFYPAMRLGRPLELLREIIGAPMGSEPDQLQVHFLFTGSEPLELTLRMPQPHTLTVRPAGRPAAYRRLLRAWWIRYKTAARRQQREGDYAPVVETYLTTMLAARLGLPLNDSPQDANTSDALAMLLGTEKLRLQLLRDSLTGRLSRDAVLDQPLPEPLPWSDLEPPAATATNVRVESIAEHVPQECFYIRFAQFPNYLWLRRLLDEYGGDLSRMVVLRGTDAEANGNVERQLGLRESRLARVLGAQVISDVAMIGRDTYLLEGAAIGILFEAKSNEVLAADLQNQRLQAVREMNSAGATMQTVQLGGREVSFASTPDHRLRSFYVQDGNYHLVTNCQAIAERFVECGQGVRTLGASREFAYARSLTPLAEDNTIFVYLSRAFFEGLLSPHYQVELPRRLTSATDAQLLQLAGLAAQAEGYERVDSQQLVKLGFLAVPVDRRSDGSETRFVDERTLDSRRGVRGAYLPIPDTPVGKITRDEAARYESMVDYRRQHWRQMDPMLIGLTRTALDAEVERVKIEARMLPIDLEKYGLFLDMLGPPTTSRVAVSANDIVSIQAVVDGGSVFSALPLHHLFFGIRDAAPLDDMSRQRLLKSLQILQTAPAYLGGWPKPGVLDRLGLQGQADAEGFRRLLLGLYRWETPDGFSLLSFDRRILTEVAREVHVEEAEDAAQIRIHVGDVKQSKFGQWANDLDFQRAWETSVGNVHLLHVLTQQLKVPLAAARRVAETVLDAALYCPLGGEYQLVEDGPGAARWASSAWVEGKEPIREAYVSPLMNWLRGLDLTVSVEDQRVVAQGVLDIERSAPEQGGIQLPLFNFFGGAGNGKPAVEEPPAAPSPPPAAEETPAAGSEELPTPSPVPR